MIKHMKRVTFPPVLWVLAVIAALVAGLMVSVSTPVAHADEGQGVGTTHNGEFFGSYDIGEKNGGGQVWCVDYGKAEPMAKGGVKYGEPTKLEGVSPEDTKVLVYALQEGKRAVDTNNANLAAAVSAVIHSAGTNKGIPFNDAVVPKEARADYDRILKNAPDVPEGTYLTVRTPENWKAGGKDGYQRVLDYDQVQTGVIEILKVDATNKKPLAGAEFRITDENGKEVLEPQVTKEDGTYRVQVNPGSYNVIEGKAPNGYLLNGDGSESANSHKVDVAPNDIMRVTFANRPVPEITVKKVDDSGQPLPGAKIRVSKDNGDKVVDFVSDGRPVVIKTFPGNYVVEELEAPEGYNREPEKIQVNVTPDSSPVVTVVNSKVVEAPKMETTTPPTTNETTPPPSTTPPTTSESTTESTTTPPSTTEKAETPTPAIGTQARLEGSNYIEKGGKIVDTVVFTGLQPGKEYVLKASTVCTQEGTPTGNTAEVKFTPDTADGQVDVPIEISDAGCAIQTVFEELYLDGDMVAEHKDANDQAQTVGMVKPVPKKPRVVIQSIPSGSY